MGLPGEFLRILVANVVVICCYVVIHACSMGM